MENKITDAEIVSRLRIIKDSPDRHIAAERLGVSVSQIGWTKQEAKTRKLTVESIIRDPLDKATAENTRLKAALKAALKVNDGAARVREEIYELSARTPAPPRGPRWTGRQIS